MEPTGIKFKKAYLGAFSTLSVPGKYKVQVQNNVSEKNLFTDGEGRQRYIVSLKAISADKLPQLSQVFADSEEVDIEQTNGLFLTASIWKKDENDHPALPMKGEEVDVIAGCVADRDGVEVLRITNIQVATAKRAERFSLADLTLAPSTAITH